MSYSVLQRQLMLRYMYHCVYYTSIVFIDVNMLHIGHLKYYYLQNSHFFTQALRFYYYCCCTLEFMLISFCKSLVFIRFCFSSICIISFTCLFILLPQFVIYGLEREKMVNKDGDKELFFPIAAKLIWNYNKVATTQCHLSF